MITYKELKVITKHIEDVSSISHYEMLQRFMFERILERISLSKYKENFILKGGLLLSALFGIDNRTTKDMDTTIKGLDVSTETMLKILYEILNINLGDSVKFQIINFQDIRDNDIYGGTKYQVVGQLENLRVNLEIDISTGDKITPRKLKYNYPSLFEKKLISIYSYNIETLLAEKIETILKRGQYNSRMKDYYDVYMFLTKLKDSINPRVMKKSIINTFTYRDSLDTLYDFQQILDNIITYDRMIYLWNKYISKNTYANEVDFISVVTIIKEFILSLDVFISVH